MFIFHYIGLTGLLIAAGFSIYGVVHFFSIHQNTKFEIFCSKHIGITSLAFILIFFCAGLFSYEYFPSSGEIDNAYKRGYADGFSEGESSPDSYAYSIGADEGWEIGHDEGYEDGYNDGYADKRDEFYNMGADELKTFLENTTGNIYFEYDDVHRIFVYAYQKGYLDDRDGIWEDITEEYVDNTVFPKEEADTYDDYFWW